MTGFSGKPGQSMQNIEDKDSSNVRHYRRRKQELQQTCGGGGSAVNKTQVTEAPARKPKKLEHVRMGLGDLCN